jgi:hypothetical protein
MKMCFLLLIIRLIQMSGALSNVGINTAKSVHCNQMNLAENKQANSCCSFSAVVNIRLHTLKVLLATGTQKICVFHKI